ncbi:MBOAT family O-acyltransferase [Metabacillus herbersteinensis]|uniref:MBOAT family O-acyltransferase n=1 Tax=Metabacillus herbersteinensis TaxID=283816 RepID=A0ABV6GFY5_9BACI
MLFSSFTFIFLFLPIVFILNRWFEKRSLWRTRKVWLLTSSLFFYAYWEPKYLLLLLCSIIINWVIGTKLSQIKESRRLLFVLGIFFNIFFIGYYKYSGFFLENLSSLVGEDWNITNILLPLAISFFTFQQIGYLVDSYKQRVHYSLLDYSLFVTFFPQLIAGPIVQHDDLVPQLQEKFKGSSALRAAGWSLFVIGLAKKILIADTLGIWANYGYNQVSALSTFEAWWISLSYTFQLYFDFSGYSDMAIGLGLLFGITLPINFNSPYRSKNIQEFWRRWHITLGKFFTQYVYFPLGGSKKHVYRNILIVFLLSGLWHGAGWNFLIWGLLHGILSIIHRFSSKKKLTLPPFLSYFGTFLFVHLAWVFFRANSINDALIVLKKLFILDPPSSSFENLPIFLFTQTYPIIGAVTMLLSIVIIWLAPNSMQIKNHLTWDRRNAWFIIILFVTSCLFLPRVQTFLYFNF